MAVGYKLPRGTRAALNAKASGGTLVVGQPYLITDESRVAIGLTTSTYEVYAKFSELYKGLSAFCSGKPAASEVVAGGIAPYAFTPTTGASSAKAVVAATASTVFTIKRDTTTLGTITFSAGATAGVFSLTSPGVTLGQNVTIAAPATPDATLADISFLVRE